MTDTIQVLPNTTATLIVAAGDGPTLVNNPGPNTVFLGDNNAIRPTDAGGIVALTANGYINVDGQSDLYGTIAAGQTQSLNILSGGLNFFSPPSLSGLGGVKIFNQAGTPTQPPTIPLNSLWFDATGAIRQWNGTTWVLEQFSGQQIITANTITVNQLAAGIVYAGIVNGTLIQGAIVRVLNGFGATIMTINKSNGTWLLYNDTGSVTQGALVASGAGTTGTDEFGNAYLAQVTGYGFNSTLGIFVAAQIGTGFGAQGAGVNLYTAPAASGAWSLQATCSVDTTGLLSFNANSYKFLSSGNLFSVPSQFIAAADTIIQQRQTSTWTGDVPSVQTDMSLNTANATSLQNLTKIWPIPANDANVGTTYRITAGGIISMGTSAQVLTFCLNVFNNSVAILLPIGAAEFLASTGYWWRAQGEIIVNTVAVSGQFFGSLSVELGVSGGNQATVAGNAQTAGGFAAAGTGSANTVAASSIALQAKWGSTTGVPALNGRYSVLERMGQ